MSRHDNHCQHETAWCRDCDVTYYKKCDKEWPRFQYNSGWWGIYPPQRVSTTYPAVWQYNGTATSGFANTLNDNHTLTVHQHGG